MDSKNFLIYRIAQTIRVKKNESLAQRSSVDSGTSLPISVTSLGADNLTLTEKDDINSLLLISNGICNGNPILQYNDKNYNYVLVGTPSVRIQEHGNLYTLSDCNIKVQKVKECFKRKNSDGKTEYKCGIINGKSEFYRFRNSGMDYYYEIMPNK